MRDRRGLSGVVFTLLQGALFTANIFAATTIGGMSFDIGVVNDNDQSADPSDYAYSNTGSVVSMSGIQPEENSAVTYFLNHASNHEESRVVATVDISQLTESSSEAGILFFERLFESSATSHAWCRLAVSGERKIYFEELSCSGLQKKLLYTLNDLQNRIRIRADVAVGMVSFSIAQPLTSTDTSWLPLGAVGTVDFSHSFGLFIQPGSSLVRQQVQFSTISITRADQLDNGIKNLAGYSTTGISGLSAWPIENPLPVNFFAQPMPFMADIRNNFQSGFTDAYQQTLFDNMKTLLDQPIEPVTGSEDACIEISIRNAQRYLADMINSFVTGEARRYPSASTQYQLYFGFSLLGYLNDANNLINSCHKAADVHWYDFLNPLEPFIRTYNIVDCSADLAGVVNEIPDMINTLTKKDKIIMDAARYILYLTLLSTLDEDFYQNYNKCVNGYIETVRNFTEKIAPLFDYNNIPMKVLSSIALWDLAHGSTTSSATLNLWLKDKFQNGGGYAEGSAYLDWLNQELLPYYYIAVYNGWLPQKLRLTGVLNSGYWLLNLADRSGNVPPIDDATNDGKFWLAPYGYLNNDNAFKEYVSRTFNATSDPVRFLTYPSVTLPGTWTVREITASEGIGKLNITSSTDNADISVAFPTEKNSFMKKNGGSHDQQDDGSISIRRVKSGSSVIDHLIIDPGYAGYAGKGDEEYYSNHNTVQINTHSQGGISPCAFGTLQQYMDKYADKMGADIGGLTDDLLGGIVLFSTAFPFINSFVTTHGPFIYHDLKNMPLDRISSGGPGDSELLKTFTNGFQGKIVFDNVSGTNFALRSVVHIGDEIMVVDQISSNQNDYSVNYNLPRGAAVWNGMNNIYTGTRNESRIRVSVYCSDNLAVEATDKAFKINELEDSTRVTSVKFSNDGTRLPQAGQYCSFLSVLEPADLSATYGTAYADVTGDRGDAQILVSKEIAADVVRYVFVNTVTNGVRGTVIIPESAGWHSEFTTDAEFGVIDFDRTTQSYVVTTLNLYSANWGRYNGVPVPFNSSTITPGAMQTKAFGNPDNSATGYFSGNKLTLCSDRPPSSMGDFTFGYWYYEGDFDFVTKLPNAWNVNTAGFMVRRSLEENDENFMWARAVFNTTNICPPLQHCGGIDFTSLEIWKSFNRTYFSDEMIDEDMFRCTRKGDKITFYLRGYSTDDRWEKKDSISFTDRSAYIGFTSSYWDPFDQNFLNCQEFDTLRAYDETEAVFASSKPNLAKSLTQLGYTTNGAPVSGWEISQQDGIIYNSTTAENQNVFTLSTPPVTISRNQNKGVSFSWKVQFPSWYYNQDFSSNNQLRVELVGTGESRNYALDFSPVLENGSFIQFDLGLTKHTTTTLVEPSFSGKYTPIGPDSWVKFRVDVLPQTSQSGTGQIKVYYDAGDGMGYVEYMNLVDDDIIDFTGMKFTYTTGSGLDRYQVNLDSIRIIPLEYTKGAAPIIATHPQSVSVVPGTPVTFSVVAYGLDLSYTWLKNGEVLQGETESSYTIPSAELRDHGSTYQCRVSNPSGTAISSVATLTISDHSAPWSSITFDPPEMHNFWHNTSVTAVVQSHDDETGVKSITYSMSGANNADLATVSTNQVRLLLTQEGSTEIVYFAEDNVGNRELQASAFVYIDKTAPRTTLNLSAEARYVLSATDNLSGIDRIEYSFDNVTWNTYTQPVSADPNKLNRFYYRAIDVAGNRELTRSSACYILASNGFDAIRYGTCEVPPSGVTVMVKNPDYLYGSLFTVRNKGTNDSIVVSWFGVTSQEKSSCIAQSKNLFGNGAQINNVCVSRGSNTAMQFTIRSATSKTYFAEIETFNWRNGTGCR